MTTTENGLRAKTIPGLTEKQLRNFWKKVEKDGHPNGCWIWNGAAIAHGYGAFGINGSLYKAHRVSYFLANGSLLEDLVLDHLCRNPSCVNPSHLEPVTQKENSRRGAGPCSENARKTHCPKGHEFTPENIYEYQGRRHCRTCRKHRNLARYYEQKEKASAA